MVVELWRSLNKLSMSLSARRFSAVCLHCDHRVLADAKEVRHRSARTRQYTCDCEIIVASVLKTSKGQNRSLGTTWFSFPCFRLLASIYLHTHPMCFATVSCLPLLVSCSETAGYTVFLIARMARLVIHGVMDRIHGGRTNTEGSKRGRREGCQKEVEEHGTIVDLSPCQKNIIRGKNASIKRIRL